jgi:hypothetical protein
MLMLRRATQTPTMLLLLCALQTGRAQVLGAQGVVVLARSVSAPL